MAYEIRGTMNRYSYCLKGYLHAKNHLGPRASPKSKLDLNFRCNCPAPESAASLSSDADTALPLADELVRLGNAPKAGSIEIAAKTITSNEFLNSNTNLGADLFGTYHLYGASFCQQY